MSRTTLRENLRRAEARLEKLTALLAEVDARLADPALYRGLSNEVATLQKKRGEIVAAQSRAEALWLAAAEALETAERADGPAAPAGGREGEARRVG